MSANRRRVVFRVVAVLLAVTVALFVLEVAVRLLRPQRSAFTGLGLYQFDPDLGHRLRPNVPGTTNALGLRDKPVSVEKTAGTYRILAIGDSFTFGSVALDDVWTEVVERRLAGSRPPVEVVNCGVPGYDTRQEIDWFEKFGRPLSPDCVVLGLFVGGDLLENEDHHWFEVVDGELVNRGKRPWPLTRLLLKSHLFRLLRGGLSHPVHAAVAVTELTEDAYYSTEGGRLSVCLARPTAAVAKAYEVTERLLEELTRTVRASDVRLVVLLIPDEIQVSRELFERVTAMRSLDRADYDLDLPQRRLRAALETLGIESVDVLEPLRSRQSREPVYAPLDTHWNAIGNAIAGEALAAHFSAAGAPPLVPK